MNILTRNLSQFIGVPNDLEDITGKYIMEVDAYQPLSTATHIVIGHVLTCIKHPDSDHLHVTTVDIGQKDPLQIVCGASNIASGQYVIVAKVGAILPGDFEIKNSVIRKIESQGMICSLKELGIDEKLVTDEPAKGIYVFDKPQKIGQDARVTLGLDGYQLTLGMTPNRGDLLSHLGFAYDLSAITQKKVSIPAVTFKETQEKNPVTVDIQTDGCGRYYARSMKVTIKASPWWLKNALIAWDIKPINNVVDITNYILMVYGTPLHAFDRKKVATDQIVVRYAKKGEKVVTLDEEARILKETDVAITNGKQIIAVGGVMGLENSMIDDRTDAIILEAAYFDPNHIRKTSHHLGLRSDSSLRFERGIDDTRVKLGLEAATQMLVELADAKVDFGIAESINFEYKQKAITVFPKRLNQKLGLKLKTEEIKSYFKRLNYDVETLHDSLLLMPPSYRKDIQIEADILEELARIHGYDNIDNQSLVITGKGGLTKRQKSMRSLRHGLANLGFFELITYSLTKKEDVKNYQQLGESLDLLLPMSDDRKTLRQSLLPGMLDIVAYHYARHMRDLMFFEMGHVFAKDVEKSHLSLIATGKYLETSWHKKDVEVDFYVFKGFLEQVAHLLDINLTLKKSEASFLHPGIQADIYFNENKVGYIGKIHPLYAKRKDVDDVYALELDLDALIFDKDVEKIEAVSKYPVITRDLSFVVDKSVAVGDILALIQQTARKLITNVSLFDIYQGNNLKENEQSLAVSITFNDTYKTLEKEAVEKALKSIKNRLSFTFKAQIRD